MENEIKPEVEKLNSTEEIQAKVQHEVAPKTRKVLNMHLEVIRFGASVR